MKNPVRTRRDIGHAIQRARRHRKLTQVALAATSGVWQPTISKIENGGDAKLETIFALLAALDLELTVDDRGKGFADTMEEIFRT